MTFLPIWLTLQIYYMSMFLIQLLLIFLPQWGQQESYPAYFLIRGLSQTRKIFRLFSTLWKTESIFHFLSKIIKHMTLAIAAQVSYCLTVAFPGVLFPSQLTYPFCACHTPGMHSEGYGMGNGQYSCLSRLSLPCSPNCHRILRLSFCSTYFLLFSSKFLRIFKDCLAFHIRCRWLSWNSDLFYKLTRESHSLASQQMSQGPRPSKTKFVNNPTQYKVSASPIVS